jgi:hypothetical protein
MMLHVVQHRLRSKPFKTSFFCLSGEPLGLELTILGSPVEDQELEPRSVYFGGHEGAGEWQWFRTKDPETDQQGREAWTPIAKTQ